MILAYLVNFINGKVECAPWFKTWYVNIFGFVFGKMKLLEWPLRKNEILAYMVTCLINMKAEFVLDVPWCETWYLNLFGSKFGKYWVLRWSVSQKRDISLYGCKFDKCEGWNCLLI